jgi:hypothetical protein
LIVNSRELSLDNPCDSFATSVNIKAFERYFPKLLYGKEGVGKKRERNDDRIDKCV